MKARKALAALAAAVAITAGGASASATTNVNWQPAWMRWARTSSTSCVLLWPAKSASRAVSLCQDGTAKITTHGTTSASGVKPPWIVLFSRPGHCVSAHVAGTARARLCRDGTITLS